MMRMLFPLLILVLALVSCDRVDSPSQVEDDLPPEGPLAWSVEYVDPATDAFVGVWGSSSSDVFVTGTQGSIFHYDGNRWASQNSGTNLVIWDVWGSSSTNVYAVAGDDGAGQIGAILHYDGTSWTTLGVQVPFLAAIWGTSENDIFAVGRNGTILHFDGTRWSQQASGTTQLLWDVGGTSPNNVFAVGGGGTIMCFNGTSWSSQLSGTTTFLRGVWVDSPTAAFAVGEGPTSNSTTVLRYNGSSWNLVNTGFTALTVLFDVWGTSPTNVHAVGNWIWRYDGSAWAAQSSQYYGLWGVWGSTAADVVAVGQGGTILRGAP